MGYIYKITNIKDGKSYIGQTKQDLNKRWKQHLKKNSNCIYLKNAVQKYGKDFFKFELICISFDNQLDKFENEYINKFNTLIPNGYNIKKGGNNSEQNKETKTKISNSLKKYYENKVKIKKIGKPLSIEHKEKLRLLNTGKKLSIETKLKMSDTRSKYIVIKIKDGIEIERYKNIVEAANKNNVSKVAISKACRNIIKKLLGFSWKYESYI